MFDKGSSVLISYCHLETSRAGGPDMTTGERARLLIRAAIDSVGLPQVGVPAIPGSAGPLSRGTRATGCNVVQRHEPPRNTACPPAQNEATAVRSSESRAADGATAPFPRAVDSTAGVRRPVSRVQPDAT